MIIVPLMVEVLVTVGDKFVSPGRTEHYVPVRPGLTNLSLLQGKKQMEIAGCQPPTVWQLVKRLRPNFYSELRACCDVCGRTWLRSIKSIANKTGTLSLPTKIV